MHEFYYPLADLRVNTWKDRHSMRWEEATVMDKAKQPGEPSTYTTPARNASTGAPGSRVLIAALRKKETRTKLHHSANDTC